ncbi:MAG: YiiD C-terminal domain-containing protein [Bacteroidota bacterium]
MNAPEDDLQTYARAHIPLVDAMDIRVLELSSGGVRLAVPLAPNLNHRATAFGGSLSAAGVFAGWAYVHARLQEEVSRHRVVIQRSSIEYLLPVETDFEVHCTHPPEAAWKRLRNMLSRAGKGRVTLDLTITGRTSEVAVRMTATYVAISLDSPHL